MPKLDFYVEEHDYEYVVFVHGYGGSLAAFPTEDQANEFVKNLKQGNASPFMQARLKMMIE